MARPMRRQLASFSSKESTLLMGGRWACRRPFATRFLRTSDDGFTGLPQCRFQGLGERRTRIRREECPDSHRSAMAPERQLAPMVRRIIHVHADPIGIEADFIAPAACRAPRDAEERMGQRDMLLVPRRDEAGAEGPSQECHVRSQKGSDGPGATHNKVKREEDVDDGDGSQNRAKNSRAERRTWPQHLIEKNVVSHAARLLAPSPLSQHCAAADGGWICRAPSAKSRLRNSSRG